MQAACTTYYPQLSDRDRLGSDELLQQLFEVSMPLHFSHVGDTRASLRPAAQMICNSMHVLKGYLMLHLCLASAALHGCNLEAA